MSGESLTPAAMVLLQRVEEAEQKAKQQAGSLSKVKAKLLKAKKGLSAKSLTGAECERLVSELRAIQGDLVGFDLGPIVEQLGKYTTELRQLIAEKLPGQVRDRCESIKLPFKKMTDAFAIGPFRLSIQMDREKASLDYAKDSVANDIPLDAQAIINAVIEQKQSLCDPQVAPSLFAEQFAEAIRVVVARQKKPIVGTIRAELPEVHKELALIRQMADKAGKGPLVSYPRVRFVIELRQFMDSEHFLDHKHEFRLEPAVIEAAHNPKKSIHIPNEVSVGYGEGKSYQAVTMRL